MFSFKKSKVNTDQALGSGRFGAVYPYQKDKNDPRWVVKIMSTKKIEEFITLHLQEIALGFGLDHPNVMPIRGFHIDYDKEDERWSTYLKLPRMTTSLKSIVNKRSISNEYFSEQQIAKFFYGLASGLQYLHDKRIAHRDIKLDNILIDKDDQIKIGDIGIGALVEDETSYNLEVFAGTNSCCAPEILERNPYLKKKDLYQADIWSLGVVIVNLCLLQLKMFDSLEPLENQVNKKLKEIEKKGYSETLQNLISSLLQHDRSKRSPLKDVKTKLEEIYPFLLQKRDREMQTELDVQEKMDKEVQVKFLLQKRDTEMQTELDVRKRIDKEVQVNFSEIEKQIEEVKVEEPIFKKEEFDIALREVQEEWKKYFKIDIEFQKSVEIYLRDPNINDDYLTGLMKEISQVRNLTSNVKNFTMNLCCNDLITDDGMKQVAQTIGLNLKSVEQFSIALTNIELSDLVTDDSVKEIALQIGSNLKNIQDLTLIFGCWKQITDYGIKELFQKIGLGLRKIKKFQLNFIDNDGIKELSTQIGSNLKNVAELTLCFDGCNKITDDGLNKLAQEIGSNLKQIQQLTLSFNKCNRITDDGFNKLVQEINLKNLKYLSLDFKRTKVSANAKEQFRIYCNSIISKVEIE